MGHDHRMSDGQTRSAHPQDDGVSLRFLFVTLGHVESDFYGRVGAELERRGHRVAHLTFSRRAAAVLARRGFEAWCLPDLMAELAPVSDLAAEVQRMEAAYDTPTFRDIYRTDFICESRAEEWCLARTVRHLLAVEGVFDHWKPDAVIPEVGNETIRTAAHLVGVRRDIPVLFLFYTIFPDPLRLYVDSMHAPIVSPSRIREPSLSERERLERFIVDFTARREPIRQPRDARVTRRRLAMAVRHITVKAVWDRDNPYLRPGHWMLGRATERIRALLARRQYTAALPNRPLVYFPLHLIDDYKIKRVVPHCADQAGIVEQVARALPQGYSLVVKEHPMSIGRTPLALLRRLRRMRNVVVVSPHANSHDLIERSRAVVVISSTVGLEALLYHKPVMTLGEPFYARLGATLDLASFSEIREAVPRLLAFKPEPAAIRRILAAAMGQCLPGAPVSVDRSEGNALALAGSVEFVAKGETSRRAAATIPATRAASAACAAPAES